MESHFELYDDNIIEYLENETLKYAKYPNSKIIKAANPFKIINNYNIMEVILLNAYSLDLRLLANRYFVEDNNLTESYLEILHEKLALCNYNELSTMEKVEVIISIFEKFEIKERNKICTEFSICRFMTIIDLLVINDKNQKLYGPKRKTILDLCAGWGDRCIGAKLKNVGYVGVDPNRELRFCYQSIDYGKMIYEPAEELTKEVLLEANRFQEYSMVICSPPFFDYEIYSNDESQSVVKFPEYEIWLNEFLHKLIKLAKSVLNRNGYFVLYVGNVKVRDNFYKLFSDSLKLVKKEFSYVKVLHLYRSDKEKNLGKFRKLIYAKI